MLGYTVFVASNNSSQTVRFAHFVMLVVAICYNIRVLVSLEPAIWQADTTGTPRFTAAAEHKLITSNTTCLCSHADASTLCPSPLVVAGGRVIE
jgi:hypothetical protein